MTKTTTLQSRLNLSFFTLLCFVALYLSSCHKTTEFRAVDLSGNTDDLLGAKGYQKPNIIIILGDDVGYEIPTIDGGESYITPNLDMISSTGMRFTRMFASPLCSPSRYMLLTGKYNFRNYSGWGSMDTTNRTIGNLLKGAGYNTFIAGKWQLGGGDASLTAFGFPDYMVWSPYTPYADSTAQGKGSRYKDPVIFRNNAFLPNSVTNGKFGDDLFTDQINSFIDSNVNHPFFVYYPITLVHYPFEPPPNNPDFATYDPKTGTPDSKYFPDMVNYMDTKIGQIISKVQSAGIAQKTLIIFVGDNGTDERIYSRYQGDTIKGGKSETNLYGTHVPMMAWWPGRIAPGSVNNNLIDLTDFLPTCAELAKMPVPSSYGVIDGKSFARQLIGNNSSARSWVFCHYDPDEIGRPTDVQRWVNDTAYKLYDTTGLFYHYTIDPREESPIPDNQLTPYEAKLKARFQSILSTMHN